MMSGKRWPKNCWIVGKNLVPKNFWIVGKNLVPKNFWIVGKNLVPKNCWIIGKNLVHWCTLLFPTKYNISCNLSAF